MAPFYALCHDRSAVNQPLDLDRVNALLRTEFIGRTLWYHESVTSTMDVARDEARASASEGAVALAEEQTAGRGRMGRSWVSPAGVNLYFTVVLRPGLEHLRQLAVIAPLAVCHGIEETTGLQPRIKWPNDVLLDGKKVCGMLPESELDGDELLFALIGIGININLDVAAYPEISELATSIRAELGREMAREEILAATLNHLETLYQALRRGEVVSMGWKQRLDTLGQHVRVHTAGGEADAGVAVDADSDGALILRRDDGSHVRVEAGEVTLRER